MEPGSRLGRYELHRILGEGGMGEVWRATLHGPAGFEKAVALKVLKRGGDELIREARLGGLLRHPHLVEVYALEQVDGRWLCAMELVEGGSLAGQRLRPAEAARVGVEVCAGLAHAYEAIGLVHLDLKPANLLLHHGQVKVADLGISRATGFADDGRVRGTEAYMAPELRRGEAVDARADVYALGVTLVELVTGTPRPSPEAVPELAAVLARCLAADPNQRFRDARALGAALAPLATARTPAVQAVAAVDDSDTYELGEAAPVAPLPAIDDAFVGRREELRGLASALAEAPGLVTLKGPAGVGKTRLASEAAHAWTGGAAAFVDLAAARSEDALIALVHAALELPGEADSAQIARALAGRGRLLLVLDNLEQLAGKLGPLATWLAEAAELRVLGTSREPVRVSGERVVELAPLPREDAVALLRARAGDRHPPDGDTDALGELAERLDCLPLTLELAAGRLRLLSPAEITARLHRRLDLLARRRGDGTRHATLRAALDWSWELLSEAERSALAQSALFAGSFSVRDAEAVLALPGDAWSLDALESLVDHSLIRQRTDGRFALLHSVRDYAAEHLAASAEAAPARLRHAVHFAARGSQDQLLALYAPGGAAHLATLVQALDDLVAAFETALAGDRPELAAQALLAAWEVLRVRGPYAHGAELARRLLAREPAAAAAAPAAEVLAAALRATGDFEGAIPHYRAAIEGYAQLGWATAQGTATNGLAIVLHHTGEPEAALDALATAVDGHLARGESVFAAMALGNLGGIHHHQGRFDLARRHYDHAVALYESAGCPERAAVVLGNLAILHRAESRFAESEALLHKALALHRGSGNRSSEGFTSSNLATLLSATGRHAEAIACYERALLLHRETGNRAQQAIVHSSLAHAHALLGDDAQAEAHFAQAVAMHRADGRARSLAYTLGARSAWHRERGRLAEAVADAEQATAHAEAQAEPRGHGTALGHLGFARALAGAEGWREDLARGERVLREARAHHDLAVLLAHFARAATARGEDGRPALARAQAVVARYPLHPGSEPAAELERASLEVYAQG